MPSFTNNQLPTASANAETRVAESVFSRSQSMPFGGGSGLFGSTPMPTPTTPPGFPGTTPVVTTPPRSGFSFGGFGSTHTPTAPTTRPRSTTLNSFGDNLTPTAAPFGVAEIRAQLPPTNKKIKSQEEYKRDNHFKLDTWGVLFNKLLLVDANLDENIIEYFIAQDHIPDSVLSKLSNYNWGQIFNRYTNKKNIILRGCENHINGDDYSEILCEAFEETNEYCPFELLKDIKKYIWIKKLYEAHPNIFCADAKKEFKLEATNYLLH